MTVPSSISNSEATAPALLAAEPAATAQQERQVSSAPPAPVLPAPIPAEALGRTWLLAIVLALTTVGILEGYFRSRGYVPSVVDDRDLWSAHRGKIYDRDTVVLLGTSRIQVDFNTRVFRKRFPQYNLVQLAIDGRDPAAALRDLAEDERFNGIVVCDMHERGFQRATREDQQAYVSYYHTRRNLTKPVDRLFATFFQRNLVVINPILNLRYLLVTFYEIGRLPAPLPVVTYSDRSRLSDFTNVDVRRYTRIRAQRARQQLGLIGIPPDQWLAEAVEIEPWVRRIQDRGGRVVLVRLPTSGTLWTLDETNYPREQCWDQFAEQSSATCIHFRDVRGMYKFRVPDMSHLDGRDTLPFTLAFADELRLRGVIRLPGTLEDNPAD